MANGITIHPNVSTGGTSWVSCSLPAESGVLMLGSTGNFYVGIGDTAPTNYIIVLSSASSPFFITVDDMSKVWVKTYAGLNIVSCASYPIGFGPIVA